MTEKYTFPKLASPADKPICHQFEIRERHRVQAGNKPPVVMNSLSDANIIVEAQRRGMKWKEVKKEYYDKGYILVPQAKKHRYAYLQDKKDKRLKALLESMSKAYPKKEA